MIHRVIKPNPLIVFISLLLSVILIASFLVWYRQTVFITGGTPFVVFLWTLVISVFWLLITRAYREIQRLG